MAEKIISYQKAEEKVTNSINNTILNMFQKNEDVKVEYEQKMKLLKAEFSANESIRRTEIQNKLKEIDELKRKAKHLEESIEKNNL